MNVRTFKGQTNLTILYQSSYNTVLNSRLHRAYNDTLCVDKDCIDAMMQTEKKIRSFAELKLKPSCNLLWRTLAFKCNII